MSGHTTLYRKWRPADFASVVGQNPVTDVLRYEVDKGKTTHAYLFCGSRGTGKTTCAKILAKAINCLSPVDGDPCGKCEACLSIENGTATDIVEMDAASNNGVDYIRDIREEVVYTPAFLKKRVYIIDEVHMLSQGAFNALLKTLEEPPPHVVFILATTELQKLPATITSRCQRFDFRRINTDDIASRLEFIAQKEGIAVTHEAAKLIGRLSQGGMRDAISLLELCSGSGQTVDVALVNRTAGVSGRQTVSRVVTAVLKKDIPAIFSTLAELTAASFDLAVFWQELIGYYRDMLVVRSVKEPRQFLDLTDEELNDIRDRAEHFTKEKLLYHIRALEDAYATIYKNAAMKRICAEMTLIRLSDDRLSETPEALLARIAALEEKLASGCFTAAPASKDAETAKTDAPPPPAASSASAEEKPAEKRETGRPLPSWAEITEAVGMKDDGSAAMLRRGRGYLHGNKVTVKVGDQFSVMLLNKDETKAALASAINLSGDAEGILPQNVSIVFEKIDPEEEDPLFSLGDNE